MKHDTQDRIIKIPEVETLTAKSRSSIYQMMKDGTFPKSIPLGARSVGWRYGDVIDWINNQAQASAA